MAKVNPYALGGISIDLENFRDEVTNLLNYGKFAPLIVTSLPNWSAQPGESVVFAPASGGHTAYYYFNSAWVSTWSVSA